MPNFTLILITYNSEAFLKPLFSSIGSQTLLPSQIILIDSSSSDNTVSVSKKLLSELSIPSTLHAKTKNLGFASAANLGLNQTKTPYAFILNPDLILSPTYFESLLSFAHSHPKAAIVSGKLNLLNPTTHTPTDNIDSLGIHAFPNRRFVDYAQGHPTNSFPTPPEYQTFAVSGTAALYNLTLLKTAKLQTTSHNEFFDESFFMYKEDVDLCWRLRCLSHEIWINTASLAWHHRGTGRLSSYDHLSVAKSRSHLTSTQQQLAFINQRLTLISNDSPSSILKHLPTIFFKELLIWLYLIIHPRLLPAIPKLFSLIPKALKKRHYLTSLPNFNRNLATPWFTKHPPFQK